MSAFKRFAALVVCVGAGVVAVVAWRATVHEQRAPEPERSRDVRLETAMPESQTSPQPRSRHSETRRSPKVVMRTVFAAGVPAPFIDWAIDAEQETIVRQTDADGTSVLTPKEQQLIVRYGATIGGMSSQCEPARIRPASVGPEFVVALKPKRDLVTVSGVVRSESGVAIPGAQVLVSSDRCDYRVVSGPEGRFSTVLVGSRSGALDFWCYASGYAVWRREYGATTGASVEIVLVPSTTHTRVRLHFERDGGEPASDVLVRLATTPSKGNPYSEEFRRADTFVNRWDMPRNYGEDPPQGWRRHANGRVEMSACARGVLEVWAKCGPYVAMETIEVEDAVDQAIRLKRGRALRVRFTRPDRSEIDADRLLPEPGPISLAFVRDGDSVRWPAGPTSRGERGGLEWSGLPLVGFRIRTGTSEFKGESIDVESGELDLDLGDRILRKFVSIEGEVRRSDGSEVTSARIRFRSDGDGLRSSMVRNGRFVVHLSDANVLECSVSPGEKTTTPRTWEPATIERLEPGTWVVTVGDGPAD